MLHILSQEFFKSGQGIGKVLEFAGEGVTSLPLDERSTLTNMAVEAGGFTGIIEADEVVVDYLVRQRGLGADDVRARIVRADPGAQYLATFDIDLSRLEPMVATPGDPRNGVPLRSLADEGRLVVVGFTGGAIPSVPLNRLLLKNISVVGAAWGAFVASRPELTREIHAELLDWARVGIVAPIVGRTYALEDGAQALRDLDERRATGKLVLEVSAG